MHPHSNMSNDQGVVYKKTTGSYSVHLQNGRVIPCSVSSRLYKELAYTANNPNAPRRKVKSVKTLENTDPVAVGDVVRFVDAHDGTGLIVEVLPRRNKLTRRTPVPMPDARPFEQVIVSNVDQVVPVFAAANPVPKWNLLDRYLALAEANELPALICITKMDLVQAEDGSIDGSLLAAVEEYRQIGYQVILTSAVTGQGIEEMKAALHGRLSVFLGKSGVGKSAMLNALQPGLGLRINQVSQVTGKGKHTTTHLEMFPMQIGLQPSAIVDTPGMREFGLWDVYEEDLALFYTEMRPLVGRCKFGWDCQHDSEPGCAIRKAVMAGKISPRRYQSYLSLKADIAYHQRT